MGSIVSIVQGLAPGTVIPKPESKQDFKVKGWGKRGGERALVYLIPNHKRPEKPFEKGITVSEWQQAYEQLLKTGCFTHDWFKDHMLRCSKEGSCNFTTIGGVFTLFSLAEYGGYGVYRKISPADLVSRLE